MNKTGKSRENQEQELSGLPLPLSTEQLRVILKQQSKTLCKIKTNTAKASGFLCRLPEAKNPVLITCNHVLNETLLKPGNEVNIIFTDENENKTYKTIKIDESRTIYTVGELDGEEIDVTIIELFPDKDKLNDNEYIEIDKELMTENVKIAYGNENVYDIYYKEGEETFISTGIIKFIKKNESDKSYTILHNCNTIEGSSGSPIILYNHKVIGVQRGFL